MRWSVVVPKRPGCPHGRLRRLLTRELPPGLTLSPSTLRPWASANFVGARHSFPCAVDGPDAATLCPMLQDQLSAIEWPLSGHIVADLVVEATNDGLHIEILTVED